MLDAVVIGSGPNGLAAGIALAREGLRVRILEAADAIGGGARSGELLQPGVIHDICSSVHPIGVSSPFFRALPLERHGLEWIQSDVALAHPLDDGRVVLLHRSLEKTVAGLGEDGDAWRKLMGPYAKRWRELTPEIFRPILHVPRHPILLARFGMHSAMPVTMLTRRLFKDAPARALFAGIAAHALLPLDRPLTSSFGITLGAAAHAEGWPLVKGGSQVLANALAAHFKELGGEIETGVTISRYEQLPAARAYLFDTSPGAMARICGRRLPSSYRGRLRKFKHGEAAYKVDYVLDGPIPWRDRECELAPTVHLAGTLEEIAASERATSGGSVPERPYSIVVQPSRFDPGRSPAGLHVVWAYCHVPNGYAGNAEDQLTAQIERFAPGFRDRIVARHVSGPPELEAQNANYVGGDIAGGSPGGLQLFFRPTFRIDPYATPNPKVFLCSSSTPPGGGVHGMCGYWAAQSALKQLNKGPKR
jgi:phytoene dehydrogenase-like protein